MELLCKIFSCPNQKQEFSPLIPTAKFEPAGQNPSRQDITRARLIQAIFPNSKVFVVLVELAWSSLLLMVKSAANESKKANKKFGITRVLGHLCAPFCSLKKNLKKPPLPLLLLLLGSCMPSMWS